jgi:hypothetical protein
MAAERIIVTEMRGSSFWKNMIIAGIIIASYQSGPVSIYTVIAPFPFYFEGKLVKTQGP